MSWEGHAIVGVGTAGGHAEPLRGGARLTRELTVADVGARVMVRHRLPDGRATDVLGELVRWDDTALAVRDRDDVEHTVARADVLAGKRIPPPPTRRSRASHDIDDLALEHIASLGWPALESEPLGEWVLRASGGFTGRGNSVLVAGDPGMPLDDAMARVRRWYADRDLPAIAAVPDPAMADVDRHLVATGWEPYNPTVVLTAPLESVLAAAGGREGAEGVRVSDTLEDSWLAGYHYRGGALPPVARTLLDGGVRAFADIEDPEGPVPLAIGRVAVGDGWAGFTAVEVATHARRRGLAGRIMAALTAWAADRGVTDLYLQAAAENDAAHAFYARLGFREHHRYRYLRAP